MQDSWMESQAQQMDNHAMPAIG